MFQLLGHSYGVFNLFWYIWWSESFCFYFNALFHVKSACSSYLLKTTFCVFLPQSVSLCRQRSFCLYSAQHGFSPVWTLQDWLLGNLFSSRKGVKAGSSFSDGYMCTTLKFIERNHPFSNCNPHPGSLVLGEDYSVGMFIIGRWVSDFSPQWSLRSCTCIQAYSENISEGHKSVCLRFQKEAGICCVPDIKISGNKISGPRLPPLFTISNLRCCVLGPRDILANLSKQIFAYERG